MPCNAEISVSTSLRAILAELPAGAEFTHDPRLREVLSGLERFVTGVLSQLHQEWAEESLDGVLLSEARKTGEREALLFGLCVLITDQSLVPMHLQLAIDGSLDEISWLELRLGERDERGLIRTPYETAPKAYKRTIAMKDAMDQVEWAYKVGFGERPAAL